MAVFLFWNLNRKPLQSIIAQLAVRHNIDIMIFAECEISTARMLGCLNEKENIYHYIPGVKCKKIEIYARLPHEKLSIIDETDRLTIRKLQIDEKIEIILAAVHFPSKLYWSDADQALECVELARKIRNAEQKIGHQRTILVGDLNMNPFEAGVVSANGLHGVMNRAIAERGSRVVQGRKYLFFYNPMWSLMGDTAQGTPGTYYYTTSTLKTYFWNMFDQVLIRPELLSSFSNKDLKILHTDGSISFLTSKGQPNSKAASDHLPLLFSLEF